MIIIYMSVENSIEVYYKSILLGTIQAVVTARIALQF